MKKIHALLAWRFYTAKPTIRVLSLINAMTRLGIILGICILLMVSSVLSGFDRVLQDKFLKIIPQGLIFKPNREVFAKPEFLAQTIPTFRNVAKVEPIVQLPVLLQRGAKNQVLFSFSGVDPTSYSQVSEIGKFVIPNVALPSYAWTLPLVQYKLALAQAGALNPVTKAELEQEYRAWVEKVNQARAAGVQRPGYAQLTSQQLVAYGNEFSQLVQAKLTQLTKTHQQSTRASSTDTANSTETTETSSTTASRSTTASSPAGNGYPEPTLSKDIQAPELANLLASPFVYSDLPHLRPLHLSQQEAKVSYITHQLWPTLTNLAQVQDLYQLYQLQSRREILDEAGEDISNSENLASSDLVPNSADVSAEYAGKTSPEQAVLADLSTRERQALDEFGRIVDNLLGQRSIILGRQLAASLGLQVGDLIRIFAFDQSGGPLNVNEHYVVSGLVDANGFFDKFIAVTSIYDTPKLLAANLPEELKQLSSNIDASNGADNFSVPSARLAYLSNCYAEPYRFVSSNQAHRQFTGELTGGNLVCQPAEVATQALNNAAPVPTTKVPASTAQAAAAAATQDGVPNSAATGLLSSLQLANNFQLTLTDPDSEVLTPPADWSYNEGLQYNYWGSQYRNIKNDIPLIKALLNMGLGFVVVLASFNVISAVLIQIRDKKRSFTSLQATGFGTRDMHATMFIYAALLAGTSVFWGVIFGMLASLGLEKYSSYLFSHGVDALPVDNYFVSYIPVVLNPVAIVTIVVTILVVSLATALVTSWFVNRPTVDRQYLS